MMLLVPFAVPASLSQLADRRIEVSEDMTAQLLVEGRFVHPGDGMTLFIRDITGSGRLHDVYLRDSRSETQHVTYTATEALLVRTETGPRLIMYNGMIQGFTFEGRRLSLTRFDDFAIDVAALIGDPDGATSATRTLRHASTLELLFADREFAQSLGTSRPHLRIEGYKRIAEPLLAFIAPLLAFSVMVLGGFNRFGQHWQIMGAVGMMVLIYVLDNAFEDLASSSASRWPFVYAAPLVGGLVAAVMLWIAANPAIFRWRMRAVP